MAVYQLYYILFQVMESGGILLVSTILAVPVWLFIEKPCENLGYHIFTKPQTKKSTVINTP